MSRRFTLHLPDLAAFQSWLAAQNIPHKPGAARYEALQVWVRHRGEYSFAHVYEVQDRPGYYTAPEKLLRTFQKFEAVANCKQL